jgi:uncharacterized protein
MHEPDLWLATDGSGRWGEMNGAHRTELDGCRDLDLGCSPFTMMLPVRRLPVDVGDEFEVPVVEVDVETLGVVRAKRSFTRVSERGWLYREDSTLMPREITVDEYGLPLDDPGHYRRR